MSQATLVPTTNPLPGSSPVAAFLPQSPTQSGVDLAHNLLISALTGMRPHHITIRGADRQDIEERSAHLVKAFDAFTAYVRAIVEDTADNLPCGIITRKDRDYVAGCLSDCAAEVVSMVAKAADEIEPEEASCWTRRAR
jgi:hypothetical protein